MNAIFVYGTLCHLPLLEVVLDRAAYQIEHSDAILPDHSVFKAREGDFPLIQSNPGSSARGLLLSDLSVRDLARLNFYESGFGYTLRKMWLRNGQGAQVFFPPSEGVSAEAPWRLAAWVERDAEIAVQAAHEVMSYMGKRSATQVAAMFPMIRARASSALAAQHAKHGAGTLGGRVTVESRERVYADFFALDTLHLSHQRFDGGMSPVLDRAVFMASDAALVLPYDAARDCVLLVEQFRLGPLARGDGSQWLLEPIAGFVDPGESAEDCARREAREEAGIDIETLVSVTEAYPSPATSSEFYYIFVGLTEIPRQPPEETGLEDEHEDLRTHVMSFDALMELVDTQQVANVPLALCAYWLARYRTQNGITGPR